MQSYSRRLFWLEILIRLLHYHLMKTIMQLFWHFIAVLGHILLRMNFNQVKDKESF